MMQLKSTTEEMSKKFNLGIGHIINHFLNLPIVALPFKLLAIFPLNVAFVIFEVVNSFVLLICIRILGKFVTITNIQKILVLSFPITLMALTIGQLSFWLLFISTLTYFYQKKGNYFASGVFVGLILLKHQYVVLIPLLFLISKKRIPFFVGTTISIGFLLLINFYMGGTQIIYNYFELLKSFSFEFTKLSFLQGISFTSLIQLFPQNLLFVFAACFYLIISVFLYKFANKIDYDKLFIVALIAGCILTPYALVYDTVILIPLLLNMTASKDFYKNWRFYNFFIGLFIFQLFSVSWLSFLFLAALEIELLVKYTGRTIQSWVFNYRG
jgi:hypothetical protein